MNARQKAKHYKKLYERMAYNQPTNLQVHNFKTSIIKACKWVPYERAEILQDSEYMEVIKNELAHDLAKELKKTMDIAVDDYPPMCVYKVYGTVRVVTGVYY